MEWSKSRVTEQLVQRRVSIQTSPTSTAMHNKLRYRCRRLKERIVLVYLAVIFIFFLRLFSSTNEDTSMYPPTGVGQIESPYILDTTTPQINDVMDHVIVKNESRTPVNEENQRCRFSGSFDDNLNKLKNLNFTASKHWVQKLGFDRIPADWKTKHPVMVTGANRRFYYVVQGLIKSIHKVLLPKFPNLTLIVYDMGFTEHQNKMMRKYCRCEVRKMPFKDLPNHVTKLKNFAFKPIIINYVLQEFGQVWWLDSSVRFTTNQLEGPLLYLGQHGALFFTYGPSLNVAFHSHKDTFNYFNEDPCPFMNYGEIEAGNVAFTNSEVGRVIVNRWVSCALDKDCISPMNSYSKCPRIKEMSVKHISACHRFDQSVLSIILRRLYHKQNDYPLVNEPFRFKDVKRGEIVYYFPSS